MTIALSAVILHRMDYTADLWRPSYRLTEVVGDACVTLQKQLRNNHTNGRAQQHRFAASPGGIVADASRAILARPTDEPLFIEESQRIARKLLDSMVPGAKPGDLLACLYTDDAGPPWLALLKMQSETAYVQETLGAVETRDLHYRLDETTIFTSGVLQKCAFVAPPSLRTPHRDLMVHDQQASPTDRENPIAAYFLRGFLGCDVPLTARQATHRFRAETLKFVRAHRDILGRAVETAIAAALREEVRRPEIDIDDFADRHIPAPELREQYAQALLDQGVPGRVFAPAVVEPEPQRPTITFTGDHGLRLEIEQEAYLRGVRQINEPVPDGIGLYEIPSLGGRRRFVITTTGWDDTTRG